MKYLLPLLTTLFIGLKLAGIITWSWLWVLAPTLIPLAILATLYTGILLHPMLRKRFLADLANRQVPW